MAAAVATPIDPELQREQVYKTYRSKLDQYYDRVGKTDLPAELATPAAVE